MFRNLLEQGHESMGIRYYIHASVFVHSRSTIEVLARDLEEVIGIELKGGDWYDDFVAFGAKFIDFEIAVIEQRDGPVRHGDAYVYQIIVMTYPGEDPAEEEASINISEHLLQVLRGEGIECSDKPPPGTLGWFCGVLY